MNMSFAPRPHDSEEQFPSDGLYYPDGTHKSRAQIRVESLRAGVPVYRTPFAEKRDFDWWTDEMIDRRDSRIEYEGKPESIEIQIPTDKPIVVAQMGDHHIAGMYHAYEMMQQHVNIISEHPLFYVALGGDMVNWMYWNPGQDEDTASFEEQRLFCEAMLDRMGRDKILWATVGDHDSWQGKIGGNFYADFEYKFEAYLIRGVTKVRLTVGDIIYKLVTAHRLPGFSMYNKVHPQARASRSHQAADAYIGFHTHNKGIAEQVTNTFDGPIRQTLVSPGPYKYSDGYGQKLGLGRLSQEELGAVWMVFWPDRKQIEAFWDVDSAIDRVAPYLS